MTLIFVEQITNRLKYTFDFVFNARGLSYEFTTNLSYFNNSTNHKFNYSTYPIPAVSTHIPCSLLFNQEIHQISLDKVSLNDIEFMSFNGCPDLVASIFFVLSRYEEYWQGARDEHERFPALCSMQSVFGWLDEPICDRWAEHLLSEIGIKIPEPNTLNIQATFYIDSVFAYREKGWYRNLGGLIKDVVSGKFKRVKERIGVCIFSKPDPFDTFDTIIEIAKDYPNTQCFWLLADYGMNNKNIEHSNQQQEKIIQKLGAELNIGIHPGYSTSLNEKIIETEKNRLEKILNKKIHRSRQHYLKFSLPKTFEYLLAQGIRIEYSMGYAETTGFRIGTARQVPWFNLATNEITELELQPFCYMDGTLNEYMKLSPKQAIEEVKRLKELVKQYGGTFSFIWHNETLGFNYHWKGWDSVFEESITHS